MTVSKDAVTGTAVEIDETRKMAVRAITLSETAEAVEAGDAFNINTGIISLSGISTVLYFKNQEKRTVSIDLLDVGIGRGGDEKATITVIKDPTAVSFSTDANIIENRNFGDTGTLSSDTDAFKGISGSTHTGGNEMLQFLRDTHLSSAIGLLIPTGHSIAVVIDPKLSSGNREFYAALVIHIQRESI